ESSRVLAIRGKVVPATLSNVHLVAEYMDGSIRQGEADIPKVGRQIKRVFLNPVNPPATGEALEAIAEADIIVLGPGSLYTSVIPNLVIDGVAEAITKSSAFKIYICNVMTQAGETDRYKASDHIKAIMDHTNPKILNACLVNSAEVPIEAQGRYRTEDSFPVFADVDRIREMGCLAVTTDLLSVNDFVRHDSEKLTKALIRLIETHRVIKR
ncbi:MAG: YvcK family protein, partial [Candidatus Omnitrophica bacterium]|nr:YvcK family protein [Candidatus Omnitrophota bacterium]